MGQRGGGGGQQVQFNAMVPLTPVVKFLLISNVAIWILFQIIVEKYLLSADNALFITYRFGLVPISVIEKWYVWQVVSYMFLHSDNVFHILFNMLLLWWLGAELEQRWGSKFFAIFYAATGVGAALIYIIGLATATYFTGNMAGWTVPVVGASGAIFGLMVAYGMLFGERIVYFMMAFPMPAKYFVMILAAVEVVTVLNGGIGGNGVANMAHLGGLLSGYLFLKAYTYQQQRRWRVASTRKANKSGLKLVVSNEKDKKGDGGSGGPGGNGPGGDGPKYWN
jgi:membrane associated rhomboid family serine protease